MDSERIELLIDEGRNLEYNDRAKMLSWVKRCKEALESFPEKRNKLILYNQYPQEFTRERVHWILMTLKETLSELEEQKDSAHIATKTIDSHSEFVSSSESI
jgi:hypothetical protein